MADAATMRLLEALDHYKEFHSRRAPQDLLDQVTEVTDMLRAPRYAGETPGERAAREVAEDHAPADVLQVDTP